jgi:hypothetical protein
MNDGNETLMAGDRVRRRDHPSLTGTVYSVQCDGEDPEDLAESCSIREQRLQRIGRRYRRRRANWVKSRDYALMPHFARIFFIAFASRAASCSNERAQKEAAERKEIGRQLTAAYYSCLRTSFASMLPTMVDRNMGIDQAFKVCRTEESKLQAFEQSLSENPNVSNAAIAAHRNTLKEELLRQ